MSPIQTKDNGTSQQGLGGLLSDVFEPPREIFPYETIKFSGRLEILDRSGEVAVFTRRQRIRFLEDGATTYLDRVWGDGVLFSNYSVRGVRIIDAIRARWGYVVILSLPRRFERGELFEFETQRRIIGAFVDAEGWWETTPSVPAELLSIAVVSPRGRRLRRPEISAPAKGEFGLRQYRNQMTLQIRQPALNIPYRLAWAWK